MFRREKGHTLSSFIENRHDDDNIIEETHHDDYYDGANNYPDTNDDVQFCIEQLNDVLGEEVDKNAVVQASIKHRGNAELALNQVLDGGSSSSNNLPSYHEPSPRLTPAKQPAGFYSPQPSSKQPAGYYSPQPIHSQKSRINNNNNNSQTSSPALKPKERVFKRDLSPNTKR